jgi:hypothetical protein
MNRREVLAVIGGSAALALLPAASRGGSGGEPSFTEPCPNGEIAQFAVVPAGGLVRVECQCAIRQHRYRADVLAERGQHQSGISQNFRVTAAYIEGAPGKIDTLQPIGRRIVTSAVDDQPVTAYCFERERGSVRIASNRLLHETKSLRKPGNDDYTIA